MPFPNFLSLDTQGTEYEILQGCRKLLKSSLLGILAEVEFHPIYKDQKLFGEVSDLLAKKDFQFVKFYRLYEMSPHRAPINLRGEGFHVYGEAIFLRKIESVLKMGDRTEVEKNLYKLAFISIQLGQLEYGLKCLKEVKKILQGKILKKLKLKFPYISFLDQLWELSQKQVKFFYPTFKESYTLRKSKGRFLPVPDVPGFKENFPRLLKDLGRIAAKKGKKKVVCPTVRPPLSEIC